MVPASQMALRKPLEAHFEHFQSGNDVNMHRICFLRYGTKWKSKKYLLAMWQVSFSRVLQTLQSVSCSFLRILEYFLQCRTFPSIATEALQTLQFSQLFISPHFTMLSAVRSIPESIAKEALQTLQSVSQLFNSLYFTMLSAVQGLPEHSK